MAVLSIQSHVAYGYVGNRAAVFALERLGHAVQCIHTVQFSNHTGYGQWQGEAFSGAHILNVAEGLEALGVLGEAEAILSGYLGRAEVGEAVLSIIDRAQAINPAAFYHCDPVMGDVGRGVFVKPEIVPYMRERVVPRAAILTPNHFEFELLVERPIRSFKAAQEACLGTPFLMGKTVVIKSFRPDDLAQDQLATYLCTPIGQSWVATTPYIDFATPPNGTGDLFSALFLGRYLEKKDPVWALEQAVSGVYNLLKFTKMRGGRELELIATQDTWVKPQELFSAQKIG